MRKNFVIAFILMLTWTFSFSLGNLLIVIFILKEQNWKIETNKITVILILISILSLINILIGFNSIKLLNDGSSSFQLIIPYLSLLLGAYVIGNYIDPQVIKYLIYFTAFESIVILIQYLFGETGFWYNSYVKNELHGELLYYSRPNGFSNNSSIVAQKLLVSIWSLVMSKFISWKDNKIIFCILLIGLILTFNRTVFLALGISYFLISGGIKIKHKIAALFTLILLIIVFINPIKKQFLRGVDESTIESFTRYQVFNNGINYIGENPIFGNHSIKYFYEFSNRKFHLHNSFLETAASNGIPIFLLVMYIILILLKRKRFFIVPILIYSFLQFGILWGIGFLDVVLFFNKNKKS